MKIHFLAMLGVDYDMDLFPRWTEYYRRAGFDSYTIFLHRRADPVDPRIVHEVEQSGFRVECSDGYFADGVLRKLLFREQVKKYGPSDIVVTADCDEFQAMPPGEGCDTPRTIDECSMIPYREVMTRYNVLHGFMIDRYCPDLIACDRDPFVQYPFQEPFSGEYIRAFVPPNLTLPGWPETRRTKILAARACEKVFYEGSHCLRETDMCVRIKDYFTVFHFPWRESARRKIQVKSYYTQENRQDLLCVN